MPSEYLPRNLPRDLLEQELRVPLTGELKELTMRLEETILLPVLRWSLPVLCIVFSGCGKDDLFRSQAQFDVQPLGPSNKDLLAKGQADAISPEAQETLNWLEFKEQCIDGCQFSEGSQQNYELKCSAVDEFSDEKSEREQLEAAKQQKASLLYFNGLAEEAFADPDLKNLDSIKEVGKKVALIPEKVRLLDFLIRHLGSKTSGFDQVHDEFHGQVAVLRQLGFSFYEGEPGLQSSLTFSDHGDAITEQVLSDDLEWLKSVSAELPKLLALGERYHLLFSQREKVVNSELLRKLAWLRQSVPRFQRIIADYEKIMGESEDLSTFPVEAFQNRLDSLVFK